MPFHFLKNPWFWVGTAFLVTIVLQIVVAIQLSECNSVISTPAILAAILFGISAIPNGIWVYGRTTTGASNKTALGFWIFFMITGVINLGVIYGQQLLTNHEDEDYKIKCNDSTDEVPNVIIHLYFSGALMAGILVFSHARPKDSEKSSVSTLVNNGHGEEEIMPLKW